MAVLERIDPAEAEKYFAEKLRFTTGPVELAKAIAQGTVRVVDVRAQADFIKEHVPESVNLPEEAWATERGLARDRANVLLCYSVTCRLAARAAVTFAGRGYAVAELEGGFEAWKVHALPTIRGVDSAEGPVDRTRAYMNDVRSANEEEANAKAQEGDA